MKRLAKDRPHVVVIAGPNGAGKSTAAGQILPSIGVAHFVNADVIARGLSAFQPESVAFAAGRIMRRRIDELCDAGESFAFETTLASRTFVARLRELRSRGYAVDLYYFWIPSAEMAIARVAKRVRSGGHHVEDDVVRRRYRRGLENFFQLYMPIATRWQFYDNSAASGPRLIAAGGEQRGIIVADHDLWDRLAKDFLDEDTSEEKR